ncbi:MAG: hypothetical protein RMJ59_02395 [Candidatus Nitrosocaldus sp.]|nr:hypothetical protein [Candidatus Nitrosocaldus sp.]MDW8275217.1 hypothetical protein [Candidatus Nitrosocaldus sp.]
MILRFIYVLKHEELDSRLRDDLPYVESMGRFFTWWLGKNFGLHYDMYVDVLAVERSPLRRLRFGLSDLIMHHRSKGREDYHIYLAYFKPLISDCSAGYYTDNFGLVQWMDYAGPDSSERRRFFAINNCTRVSHIILHEVGRRKGIAKRYNDAIHDLWREHVSGVRDYEYYDSGYRRVSRDGEYEFATMLLPD